ncbi:hypothetical protein Y032_0031g2431 [Ancylostoma ceylanicum]|uniref:Uncharacterized protein n=1 Tax=Ancylostoma ceylanicum TaxID=53326 RepID=A0A016UPN3_9BILA|nr:hypothetical protein Y032_0031g2431 [Ancylostoma ceylanicum]
MKAGKATDPDDMATEVWKSQCWSPAYYLTKFFNLVVAQEKVPMDWQQSITIPIWEGNGNPADCTNYRPIRLLSHTMKIDRCVSLTDGFAKSFGYLPINAASYPNVELPMPSMLPVR